MEFNYFGVACSARQRRRRRSARAECVKEALNLLQFALLLFSHHYEHVCSSPGGICIAHTRFSVLCSRRGNSERSDVFLSRDGLSSDVCIRELAAKSQVTFPVPAAQWNSLRASLALVAASLLVNVHVDGNENYKIKDHFNPTADFIG